MIRSLEEIKEVMRRYYLNEIRGNDELRSLYKGSVHDVDIVHLLQMAIQENDKDAVGDIFHLGFTLEIFTGAVESLFAAVITEKWHNKHEDIAGFFQNHLYKNSDNITVLLRAMEVIPEYLMDDDFKYPYIRKIIYAIGAQPEPHNLDALGELTKSKDDEIRELALHQIEVRKRSRRWEAAKNVE